MNEEAKAYKVVLVKHPNCGSQYMFSVPDNLALYVGDWVLCDTKKHKIPQVAQCITPSFRMTDQQLVEFYRIQPVNLQPVVGVLQPVMYAHKAGDQ